MAMTLPNKNPVREAKVAMYEIISCDVISQHFGKAGMISFGRIFTRIDTGR
ncbi:MAG: hypothetical protein BWY63_02287 [Chloroflexi bacterium ADurb.Bin360]|nr:MAG: hypothetical protein BWY63_02287 [Chloroflexi bacterium ADurb.Bin360]